MRMENNIHANRHYYGDFSRIPFEIPVLLMCAMCV